MQEPDFFDFNEAASRGQWIPCGKLSSTLRALSPPQRSHVVGARCPFKGFAHGTARHLRGCLDRA